MDASESASSESAPPTKGFATDPALYIFTSLTSGSSHIVTATSRLETILRANKVPFKAVDIATNVRARMIWTRRAGKDESGRVRKMPGLVQRGVVLGDLTEIEDWNEYGELKQHVTMYYDEFTQPSISQKPKTPPPRKAAVAKPPIAPVEKKTEPTLAETATTAASTATAAVTDTAAKAADTMAQMTLPIRSIAAEAAAKAKEMASGAASKKDSPAAKKEGSSETQKENVKSEDKAAPSADAAGDDKPEKSKPGPIPVSKASTSIPAPAGLQSPTSGAWSGDSGGLVSRALQSPTSSSWVPKDVEPPITQLHGAKITSASQEKIRAVEAAATIQEESEEDDEDEEDEEDEEDDDDDDGDDDDDEESEEDEDTTQLHGAKITSASQEKIKAVEKASAILEVPEEDDEDDDDHDDEDEESEDESDDKNKNKPAVKDEKKA